MQVSKHTYQEWSLMKWLAIVTAAGVRSIFLASQLAEGGDTPGKRSQPGLLPASIELEAQPLPAVAQDWEPPLTREAMTGEIWTVLSDQHAGKLDSAICGWTGLRLPEETDVWRKVALAKAYLASDKLPEALAALKDSCDGSSDAVVHYLTGLVRLRQASAAYEWYEAVGPRGTTYVAYVPAVVPNSRSMYKLAALEELTMAVELSSLTPLHRSLLPIDDSWISNPAAAFEPTVQDLLMAIGIEEYVDHSHVLLGALKLEKGLGRQAERHFDEAASHGYLVTSWYRRLGDAYVEQGQYRDAARVYLKDVRESPAVAPVSRVFEAVRKGLLGPGMIR